MVTMKMKLIKRKRPMMYLVYLIAVIFNLGEQELITWSGASSDD